MISPGCFGVPSIYSFKSRVCQGCFAKEECQKKAHEELISLRGEPHIAELLNEHTAYSVGIAQSHVAAPRTHEIKLEAPKYISEKKRFALSEGQMQAIADAPKKVSAVLRTIWTRGLHLEMVERFKSGLNPFDSDRHRTLHAIYAEIQQSKRTRSQLVETLQTRFDWTYASAYPEISNMWKVLIYLGFAEEDGTFLVRAVPSSSLHN